MLELKYKYDANTIMKMKNEFNNKIDEILNNIIKPNMTEFQKEIAIHDYIVLNTNYILDTKGLSFTSYGCIVNNEAVCDGYTRAMQILLNKVGIYAIRVVGFAGTDHAWNIVKINNKFYHVDATWNDSNFYKTNAHYKYLNVTDEELSKDHVWDRTKFPKCTDNYFKYLHKAKSVVKDNNYIYYSNKNDGNGIYKMSFDGKEDIKIFQQSATYLAQHGEWIYFSNYSDGGNLYKIKKDGQELSKILNVYVKDLYIKDGYLYYYNINNAIEEKLKLEDYIEDKEKLEILFSELFKGYKFWENRYNVHSNKIWTINFNSKLKEQELNKIVYVLDGSLNIVPNIDTKISNKSIIVKNRENYKLGSTYYLVIKNSIKNYKNINLQQPIIMKFFITY
ncbi:DUF5050 domain-containing protein [Clostridium niameyense]|uniref:DUF5050 domain-containing protein n=1 Tax=Clostridium niameyense TaxID=1622073 RepID=UPI00067ED7AB|nr:DUF5050 domain-containing protein [Clostridium niameyense]